MLAAPYDMSAGGGEFYGLGSDKNAQADPPSKEIKIRRGSEIF